MPEHLADVRGPKLALIAKTEAAVKDRLTKEITYWDHRAAQLQIPILDTAYVSKLLVRDSAAALRAVGG